MLYERIWVETSVEEGLQDAISLGMTERARVGAYLRRDLSSSLVHFIEGRNAAT
jgi:hypothetical protein